MFKWIPLPYKIIGLVSLLAGLITIYAIHRNLLIQEGYASCQMENQEIIEILQQEAQNATDKARYDRQTRDRNIDTADGGDSPMPVSTDVIRGVYEREGSSGQ